MSSVISASTTSTTALTLSGDTSGQLEIKTGASPTTAVTIDTSQNVGIGTTSPTGLLDINKNSNAVVQTVVTNLNAGSSARAQVSLLSDSANGILAASSSTNNAAALGGRASTFALFTGSGDTAGGIALLARNAAGYITMHTGGNGERMRIDSSGNVLVGTTGTFSWEGTTGGSVQTARTTFNPIISSTFAASTAYPALVLAKSRSGTVGTYTYPTSGDRLGTISFAGANTNDARFNDGAKIEGVANQTWTATAQGTYLRFFTTADASVTATERMRITSGGDVCVGNTAALADAAGRGNITINGSSSAILSLGTGGTLKGYLFHAGTDMVLQNSANGYVAFSTNATERARITSGGDILVAKTTADAATLGVELRANGRIFSTLAASTSANDTLDVYSTGAGAYRFYVQMDGKVNATNTTIAAISDQRLKENIQDIDVGLDALMALKPRKFDWKEGKGKNIKGDRGWIAQEFEQVFPEMIGTWKDPAPEGEEPYKSVAADLIPVLVKAIQELKAELDEAKAKIQALKGAK